MFAPILPSPTIPSCISASRSRYSSSLESRDARMCARAGAGGGPRGNRVGCVIEGHPGQGLITLTRRSLPGGFGVSA